MTSFITAAHPESTSLTHDTNRLRLISGTSNTALANAVLDVPLINLSLSVSCVRLVFSGCAAVIKLVTVPPQARNIFTNLQFCSLYDHEKAF